VARRRSRSERMGRRRGPGRTARAPVSLGVGVAPVPAAPARPAPPAAPAAPSVGVGVRVLARQASGGDDGLERSVCHDCLLLFVD
jgi:hypothetical protein